MPRVTPKYEDSWLNYALNMILKEENYLNAFKSIKIAA